MFGLWIIDLLNSVLNERYVFHEAVFAHKPFQETDRTFRLENVKVKVYVDDVFETFMWGGRLVIEDPQSKTFVEIENVWDYRVQKARIEKHLPGEGDRSHRH